jgi:hypothetical protein
VTVKHNEFWEILAESKQKKPQMKGEVVKAPAGSPIGKQI